MSGRNSKTRTRAWQAILPPPISNIFPPGTGAVVEAAGVPSVVNGPAGSVLTSNGPASLPSFQFTNTPRQPLGAVRFIDPSNSTGFAADTNTGATSTNVPPGSGPILTTDHLSDLLANRRATANATITYMSDDTSGQLLDLSTLEIAAGVVLTFQGTPQVLHTGGTLDAGTVAINPATNQQQTLHATDIADWTPFIFNFEINGFGTAPHPTYVVATSGGDATDSAWVVSDGGGDAPHTIATADASRPVTPGLTAGSLTIGDSYRIQRGSLLALAGGAGIVGNSAYGFGVTDVIVFKDFAFTLSSVGINGCTYDRCSFENEISVGGFYNHCFVGSDFIEAGLPVSAAFVSAGAVFAFGASSALTGNPRWTAPLVISGDTYWTGETFILGASVGYANVQVSPGIGAGLCVNRMGGGAGISVGSGEYDMGSGQIIPSALVWGKQNIRGWIIGCNASVTASDAAGKQPTVTGNTSDFEFRNPGGARTTVARAFDETIGAYTEAGGAPTRTTTYVHLTGTIAAGGFGGGAHDVSGNGHFVLSA